MSGFTGIDKPGNNLFKLNFEKGLKFNMDDIKNNNFNFRRLS